MPANDTYRGAGPTGAGRQEVPNPGPRPAFPLFRGEAWAILDEHYRELVVCPTRLDAARAGNALATAAGHRDFYMWDVVDRCIECWAPE